jgi:hypothetical protein
MELLGRERNPRKRVTTMISNSPLQVATTLTTALDALQPEGGRVAAGSDLTGTSGADIARSCPKPVLLGAAAHPLFRIILTRENMLGTLRAANRLDWEGVGPDNLAVTELVQLAEKVGNGLIGSV